MNELPASPEKKGYSAEDFQLALPDQASFETTPPEELHAMWRKNHAKLRDLLQKINPPFFGLHGTSQNAAEAIEASQGGHFEIATFYDKAYDQDQFLYQLYAAAMYTVSYAKMDSKTNTRPEKPGKLFVFNVERKEKNKELRWERLKSGSDMSLSLSFDTDGEREQFENLREEDNLLWRSDMYLSPDNFAEYSVGTIDLASDELLPYSARGGDMAHIVFRQRLLAQQTVAQTLRLFADRGKDQVE